jgi:hypothetical protein
MNTKIIINSLVTLAIVAVGIFAFLELRGQGDYVLRVSPTGNLVIQRTDNATHGGPFRLRGTVEPGTYILGSEDDSKGIYTVTFHNTMRRPGWFILAIGKSSLDIKESRILFDLKEEKWQN